MKTKNSIVSAVLSPIASPSEHQRRVMLLTLLSFIALCSFGVVALPTGVAGVSLDAAKPDPMRAYLKSINQNMRG